MQAAPLTKDVPAHRPAAEDKMVDLGGGGDSPGLLNAIAPTGTRLPLTLRLCPNVERSIPGAMGHCGARHSVI